MTKAMLRALKAVQTGKVTRAYTAKGNVYRGPKGIGAAAIWALATDKLIVDGPTEGDGVYERRCSVRLTMAGQKALDNEHA